MARDERIAELVDRLELGFNSIGVDKYGVSKKHLRIWFGALGFLYRKYFRVKAFGIEHIPARTRAMLVGNHSGGVALDANENPYGPPRGARRAMAAEIDNGNRYVERVGGTTALVAAIAAAGSLARRESVMAAQQS